MPARDLELHDPLPERSNFRGDGVGLAVKSRDAKKRGCFLVSSSMFVNGTSEKQAKVSSCSSRSDR